MLAAIGQNFLRVAKSYYPNIDEHSDFFWAQLIQKHPYSAIVYLLLMRARYFSKGASASMLTDTQQANAMEHLYLFFYENPLWVNYLLKRYKMEGKVPRSASLNVISKMDTSAWTQVADTDSVAKPVYKKRSIKHIKKEMLEKALALPRKRGRPPKRAAQEEAPLLSAPITSKTLSKKTSKQITAAQKTTQNFNDWLKSARKVKGSLGVHFTKEDNEEVALYTLTMARLYEKQGNIAKALEVYEKLMQQEPSKKTTFAQKIAQLKKKL